METDTFQRRFFKFYAVTGELLGRKKDFFFKKGNLNTNYKK